ncbi:SBBP repeat-containing protein [Niastella sp. OAS944]|uniref:SBBP repeat-containing protein n=1 Tax=Niastella sp. OAS944 TaxID=2664089 RepID=UPI00346BB824|nr:hypothetical protein [Chitinophagaceae bacterium OAS944]
MKNFTFLFFLLITFSISNAQSMFSWVKSSTSTGQLAPSDVVVDASGNVYTTGSFVTDADFDPGTGTQILTSAGSADIFITKRSLTGDLLWAKRIGDTRTDGGTEIGLDASGNVYVSGYFSGTVDFDPGPATQPMSATLNRYGIFILKLDASGNFVWAKSMVGNNNATAWAMAVDAAGNAYTTGDFSGTVDFDPGAGVQNLTAFGRDIFISKIDANGNYVWAKSITSSNTNGNRGVSIAVDAIGNVYTTGGFRGDADFDPGPGTNMLTLSGSTDAYILKLNSSGDFEWAKSLGGTADVFPTGIAVDASGAVYSTGSFEGTVDFDPGTGTQDLTSTGQEDIYISKLDASGNYVWATRMGESNDDYASGISIDAAGNVYTTGVFEGTMDVDPGGATHDLVSAGDADIFVVKLTTAGSYAWSANIGSTSYDAANAITVANANNIYLLGTFDGTVDFDPGTGTQDLTSATSEDTYILHLSPDITLPLSLLHFDAVDNSSSVLLQWQTTREQSMAGFEIERSTNGKKFETIGSIAVNNGYNLINNYSFTDLHPLTVKSYYRLKIKDQDGQFTYSRIIALRRENSTQGLQVYPNPAKNILNIELDAHETITLQISDVTGHILYQQNKTMYGNTNFSVNIQTLPAGNYYLIIKGKNTQKIQQFLKQ